MFTTMHQLLILAAVVSFSLAAFKVSSPNLDFVALGFALVTLSLLV